MKLSHFLILSILIHGFVVARVWVWEKPSSVEIIEAEVLSPGPKGSSLKAPQLQKTAARVATPSNDKVSVPDSRPEGTSNNSVSDSEHVSGSGSDQNRPPKILKEIFAPYPKEARRSKIEGDVVLKVIIDENGKVLDAEILESLGYGLDEAAITAIRQFIFSPGFKDGKIVRTQIKYRYKFRLD